MTSVGTILRSARESQGRGVAEIAEELCITQRYLCAIEKDDLKSLPGTFFYRSFVRQYAVIVGVPEQQIRRGLDELTAGEEDPPLPGQRGSPCPVREPDPIVQASNRDYFTDRRIAAPVAVLVGVLAVCSGFYAWWNRPPQIRAGLLAKAAPAAPELQNGAAPVEVAASVTDGDLNHVVLNLSATERTWLSITSEGKEVFSGILQPSQTKTLTGLEGARMKVGNAGGIEIRWNGKEIGPIGGRGQVKTILFTPDNFQILEPPPPPATGESL
jgi:cytoskeleton protein RodZ